ncbi:flagellar hook-associated protein FlgK [Falsibacillus pallidus]|uniref:Flagellar hook-associated protein 1 n=1 Tax=Falsibacillus pallidus TaxID=493781 RepID=A0A370GA94_9BACI|nr:flagellar hook-associated protein FlgK [Falsibacillus pallidus]RDI40120.1 flagellar hook-associated protein 1 FlgK [Falsibacillus pallidus]
MTSTFHGLETARRGLVTQQNALYVTGHNISNANTPGFSRQRVNFVQTEPYPAAAMNRPQIPGQMGTGVEAGSIQRVRESFLDYQYQGENNKLGYWSSRATSLSKMESIMNEPSEDGLSAVMGQFWQSLQDLSVYPENQGTRSVVLERGQAVVDTFHYLHDSLTSIKDDLGNEVSVGLRDINSILKKIGDINESIASVEPHGYLPNDLYDERDNLVDQLSEYVNIKVEKVSSGGNSLDIAEGKYNIKLLDASGKDTGVFLVNGADYSQMGFQGGDDKIAYNPSGSIEKGDLKLFDAKGEVKLKDLSLVDDNGAMNFSQGKLRGLIESYGYKTYDASGTETGEKGIYPDMLDNLDKLAFTFGNVFNAVQKEGYGLPGTAKADNFFNLGSLSTSNYKGASSSIQMADLLPEQIAASTIEDNAGDGTNAINMSNIQGWELSSTTPKELEGLSATLNLPSLSAIGNGTMKSFYEGMIGKLGVDAQQANRLQNNSQTLRQSVDENRQSVSSVSLDEEMTNMIKFQAAYNAAARNITIIDEMLDKIINGLGTGGR